MTNAIDVCVNVSVFTEFHLKFASALAKRCKEKEKASIYYNRIIFEPKPIENQHLTSNKCHFHAVDGFKISLPVCRMSVPEPVHGFEICRNAQLSAYTFIIL